MKSSKYQQGVLHQVPELNDQLPSFQHIRCQENRKSNKEIVIVVNWRRNRLHLFLSEMATWNSDQVMDFKVLRVETYILIFK
jgi:hypothetical protein